MSKSGLWNASAKLRAANDRLEETLCPKSVKCAHHGVVRAGDVKWCVDCGSLYHNEVWLAPRAP